MLDSKEEIILENGNGNGDGTRKGIAQEYSLWSWTKGVYIISEKDGRIIRYQHGIREEISGPYR